MQAQISKKRDDVELKQINSMVTEAKAVTDQVILDDLIVDGSACVGQDCVDGESFGFDTIRLKENNLRIKAQDTSNSASFPGNDWQITFNDTSNGGLNKFSIDDIDGGRTPFTIEAGARTNALYVEADGDVGINTANPAVELHTVGGDSPTLRIEQDGSSGFQAQTWDMAGNETNFFIRDVTNGSLLPFKIKPGAPTNSLFIAADGDVGLGTQSPRGLLDVQRGGTSHLLVTETEVYIKNAILPGASAPSDERLKKNIVALTDATNLLMKVFPKSYFYREDIIKKYGFSNQIQYGVVAQELEKVLPELVTSKNLGQGDFYKTVDYNSLIPILIQGFKEQQSIIAQQQAQLSLQSEKFEVLEARLSSLENTNKNAKR
ncbi:hypothetical protein DJ013_19285 [Arcticibacterium luteifluviistationis]|uniref:Peptidase S74 domain-containing protein n=2 Tax=Arcticibacterium luteifluviistationis TaxID=1784714 RepID=A0A2Z4GGJ0_9BACT|nr:hypothetical protein DJ013_19285 [Arcticibacterium luteifluviistationis]